MKIYLDPVGGLAGDMFIAALVDAWPEIESELRHVIAVLPLPADLRPEVINFTDRALSGRQFRVVIPAHDHHPPAVRWWEIRHLLGNAALPSAVVERAQSIFALLAGAEAQVHGVPEDDVSFHEVGAWDSIVDIVAAAHLIEALGATEWSCGSLPLGSGRVPTAHGLLPVPTPATVLLLKGFPVFQDGLAGERITPTGAAILRHLTPSFAPLAQPSTLVRCGTGFGSRHLQGIANILRVLAFENTRDTWINENIIVIDFEVDDQSAEDLAVGLERLRAAAGVLDVVQSAVIGKKGRLASHVEILLKPEHLNSVIDACFIETTTIGLRWRDERRALLERRLEPELVDETNLEVKIANRPAGKITAKADIENAARAAVGHAARADLRYRAEDQALAREQGRD